MKTLMLEHAFGHTDEVWLHIASGNLRSRAATAKLGATERYQAAVAVSGPARATACYAVARDEWPRSPAATVSRAAGLAVLE